MENQHSEIDSKQSKLEEKSELAMKKLEKDMKDIRVEIFNVGKELQQASHELKRRRRLVKDELLEYREQLRMLLKKQEVQEYMIKGRESQIKELEMERENERIIKEYRDSMKKKNKSPITKKHTFKEHS